MRFIKSIKSFIHFLARQQLLRLVLLILLLLLFGAVLLTYLEPNMTFLNAIWLSIVTLTTVGYGDITPTTVAGKVVGVFIMVFGIGTLGMFTARIASIFVENKLREDRGMNSFDFKNHIIICTWNPGLIEIVNELRADPRCGNTPIVLIAETENKPIDDDNLYFLKGPINEENLKRANLAHAHTVIILGDESLGQGLQDAKSVLATLTVESINPDVYTIVELVNEENIRHCQRAQADEIIVASEFNYKLMSRAALDHGISKVVSDLLSSRYGDEIHKVPVPPELSGKQFLEIFTEMKKNQNSIALAVQKINYEEIYANPPNDHIVNAGDFLFVIKKSNDS
jgi:voltage-gated potassium channel